MLPETGAGRRPRAGGGRDAGVDETARGWHRMESEPQGWERPGLRKQRGEMWANQTKQQNPRLQPTPTPSRAGAGTAWDPSLLGWAGLGWQAGWHRLWQRQMERGGGLTPGPPGNGWDCLFAGALPLPPPPTSRPGRWLGKRGWGKTQHFRAGVSTSSCSLWLSVPANGMHCLLPAWLWQRLRCWGWGEHDVREGGGRERSWEVTSQRGERKLRREA